MWTRSQSLFLAILLLNSCAAVRHPPSSSAVFRIESRDGALHLIPPSLPGGPPGPAIPFSQVIPAHYGYNPWEQYVDLSPGMRLAVTTLTGKTETTNDYFGITNSFRGLRIRNVNSSAEPFDRRARFLRLFYQNKFVALDAQPIRPALCLWSDSHDDLAERTARAKGNPNFSCDTRRADCRSFPGRTTVSPEVPVSVNQKVRYVLLGSTIRDILRADRVSENVDLHVLRKYRDRFLPVTWEQRAFVQSLPLVTGDQISW